MKSATTTGSPAIDQDWNEIGNKATDQDPNERKTSRYFGLSSKEDPNQQKVVRLLPHLVTTASFHT
jgi:hypothetical protein